jgi:Fe-S oxidoreductase
MDFLSKGGDVFEIKDARKEPVEYLWFVGDYASFDPRVQEVTQAAARLFHRAGLDFGILYDTEQNAGNDIRRLGEEGLFEMLRDKNLEALDSAQFETIVTTDPHTYFVLKHEYGLDGKVKHYTEVLDELISSGRLEVARNPGARVTYHDPCYLGRYGGVYDAPRGVLEQLGLELVEMPRNRSSAYCCGAGGGQIWMEDTSSGGERPAESRVREAAGLSGVTTMVVACPKDLVMFRDALKTADLEGSLVIRDIAELVAEAMSVEEATSVEEANGAAQRSGI